MSDLGAMVLPWSSCDLRLSKSMSPALLYVYKKGLVKTKERLAYLHPVFIRRPAEVLFKPRDEVLTPLSSCERYSAQIHDFLKTNGVKENVH